MEHQYLLDKVNVKNNAITIDAMETQTDIAEKIKKSAETMYWLLKLTIPISTKTLLIILTKKIWRKYY